MLTQEIKDAIDECVLCWLATTDRDGIPNCSPKEAFSYDGDRKIVIANIASPGSVRNIRDNPRVCVSFVNILTQRGFKVRGTATYLEAGDADYDTYLPVLSPIVGNAFPIKGVMVVTVTDAAPIIAPSYYMIPGTTVESQVAQSRKTYGLDP